MSDESIINAMHNRVKAKIEEGMQKAGVAGLSALKASMDSWKDTGNLLNSTHVVDTESGVEFRSDADYAGFVEYHSHPYMRTFAGTWAKKNFPDFVKKAVYK